MRILIAGATGTLGRPVVRQLVASGHQVSALLRPNARRGRALPDGVDQIAADALDARQVRAAARAARPDVVVDLLTAIPPGGVLWPFQMRQTNELRVRATAHLLRAAIEAGASRFVAESFIAVHGLNAVDEDQPLAPAPGWPLASTVAALRSLEAQLRAVNAQGSIDAVALRIGFLYGADVPSTRILLAKARSGSLFVPRPLRGIGAFVHQLDAADAIVAAVEHPSPSAVYHVVDDVPLPLTMFFDAVAAAAGAAPPRTVPAWVAALTAPLAAAIASGRYVVSNARARRELAWTPRYPSVHAGIRQANGRTQDAA